MDLELILPAILILGIGGLIGYLVARLGFSRRGMAKLREDLEKTHVSRDLHTGIIAERDRLLRSLEDKEHLLIDARSDLAARETTLSHLEEQLARRKEEIKELQTQFRLEFEKLAQDILKSNTREFAESNKKQITEILDPLREKLGNFEKKVEDTYQKQSRDRSELKGEIKQLMELNQRISEEAHQLATALKGDQKQQGNWGELILERILERSGLRKGIEYQTQVIDVNSEGKRIKPDVVLHLPDDRHIIIDAKVSLTAYDRFVNADEPLAQKHALKEHITSLRNHIKGLAQKSYSTGTKWPNPDFVLMFLPIESSFSAAIRTDDELFHFAWDQKIVIVSPTTLLATLRTVASIWKQEKQTRNALEIADQAAKLYDKFVGFVEDLEKIGRTLEQSRESYNQAMNKLQTGRGNLIGRTEKMRKLGLKTRKQLPKRYIDIEQGLNEEE